MFARGLRGVTERSAVETRSPLANITTAEWGVTFGSNGKILEIRTHSFGYNVIVWECLPLYYKQRNFDPKYHCSAMIFWFYPLPKYHCWAMIFWFYLLPKYHCSAMIFHKMEQLAVLFHWNIIAIYCRHDQMITLKIKCSILFNTTLFWILWNVYWLMLDKGF